jgi:hypothetical protein
VASRRLRAGVVGLRQRQVRIVAVAACCVSRGRRNAKVGRRRRRARIGGLTTVDRRCQRLRAGGACYSWKRRRVSGCCQRGAAATYILFFLRGASRGSRRARRSACATPTALFGLALPPLLRSSSALLRLFLGNVGRRLCTVALLLLTAGRSSITGGR